MRVCQGRQTDSGGGEETRQGNRQGSREEKTDRCRIFAYTRELKRKKA